MVSPSAAASSTSNIIVVGGNGFLGSAICKAFLGANSSGPSSSTPRKIKVTSISPSGRPFVSPAGHQPAWSASPNMTWVKGDALSLPHNHSERERLAELFSQADAVVHTVGILLESRYKPDTSPSSSRAGSGSGSFAEIAKGVLKGLGVESPLSGSRKNPLAPKGRASSGKGKQREVDLTYERMNRDTALSIASLYASNLHPNSPQAASTSSRPAFVYISASDIFRPLISSRYIDSKRAAESGIWDIATRSALVDGEESMLFKPYFMRPGLMYHPHTRPISTLPAALFDFSSNLHQVLSTLPLRHSTPASLLRSPLTAFLPSATRESMARLLTFPPLHVDTVAKAVVNCVLEDGGTAEPPGAKGVDDIRRLAGWKSFTPVEVPEEVTVGEQNGQVVFRERPSP